MGFDFEQRLLPRAPDDSPVRVIDIDEASLSKFGQWPWPRAQLATLTKAAGRCRDPQQSSAFPVPIRN